LGLLCTYLKEKKIKVFWTFHDCWAFTGYCPHYDMAGCGQWKTQCQSCIQRKHYTWFRDRSAYLYREKRAALTGLDMTIVTPSQWLADQVKQSFLKEYPVKVIRNGIDLSVFQPRESDFRQKYGIERKHVVLGVAFGWGPRKGLDVFVELAKRLDDTYQIVLVGTDDTVDGQLPSNILSIHRTQNAAELAEIYSAADVFVNPTREENYPTTHMEALACGTPVVSFATGGSLEMLDTTCGCGVPKNDVDEMERMIRVACEERPYTPLDCVKKAEAFQAVDRFKEYVKLYEKEDSFPD
jgi:glycosyltransferase involved in cell wall biosynthesis